MLASEGTLIVVCSTSKKPQPAPCSCSQGLVDAEIACVEEVVVAGAEDHPPDGGLRAWLVVFGVAIGMGATIGIVTSWGTWQAYYEAVGLRTKSSSEIAWIGSVQSAMTHAPGLLVGRLFDMGYFRLPVFASSVLFVACMFLTAECTQYWQLLLFQGFGLGVASGVVFNIGNMVLTHWFKKRLGLALAITYSGISVFGWVFPIVVETLLKHTGFQWTMRVLALIALGLLVATNLTAVGRIPGTQDLGPLLNLAEFTKPVYAFYVAAVVVNALALTNTFTYITVSAVNAGVDVGFSYDLVAIINAASAPGQLVGGLLADRYDPIDVLIYSTLLAALVNVAWPFATHAATFAAVAVLGGVSAGGVWAAMVQPFERMGSPADVGLRIGMAFTLVTVGVVAGSPVAGAIFDATQSYSYVGCFSGAILALSAGLMVIARRLLVKYEAEVCDTSSGGGSGQSHQDPVLS